MRPLTTLLLMLALLSTADAHAQQPGPAPAPAPTPAPSVDDKEYAIEAPASLAVYVDRPKLLVVKCDKAVTLLPPSDDDDITVMPTSTVNQFSVRTYAAGSYSVVLMVASKGSVKFVKVAVTASVKPPKPGPNPAPTPPNPGPNPTPPAPVDPLAKDLQSAYSLDTTADKAVQVQALAAVYKSAVEKVKDATTGALLLSDLKAVTAAMKIPDSAIPLVRSRIAVELKKAFVAGQLTDANKATLKALFQSVADGLAACK